VFSSLSRLLRDCSARISGAYHRRSSSSGVVRREIEETKNKEKTGVAKEMKKRIQEEAVNLSLIMTSL
jgi:hypothetical protein